jgi:Ca-activated chloride channel family protein
MNFEQIKWANPEGFYLFIIPVFMTAAVVYYLIWRKGILKHFKTMKLFEEMTASHGSMRFSVRAVMHVVILLLLVLVSARPQYGMREMHIVNSGVDIAVILDVSKSMKVKDIVPDRLTGAVIEVSKLLDTMKGGRVTLVPFAGIPFLQTPLTSDFEIVKTYMRELKVVDMPVPGTAMGRAVQLAAKALNVSDEDKSVTEEYTGSSHKVILLVTDGENHEGDPEKVVKDLKLREKGIRIFTIGVGTPSGQPIPLLDENGLITGTAKEKDGKTPIFSKLNEDLLKKISEATDGRYFQYSGNSVAKEIYDELQKLEQYEIEENLRKFGEDRFQIILFPAILLLAADLLINERRRRKG